MIVYHNALIHQVIRDRSLFTGGGGPLYLGGESLFFELHFGEGHFFKKIH